uniref:Recombinase n=1 Tax=uncultured Thiotrichaceae bacterium TaxID=298394 RepID=A0A6S6U9I4_9GAMM|nr:MAG: Unknown protein [uncultured Thiotrichaceae bacterium]
MDNYEKYEQDCKEIRAVNEKLLNEFEVSLKSAGLSAKTIKNHSRNIKFYVNEFLLYEEAIEAKEGVDEVDEFLGYWFIKKAMWASQSSIRSYATSLKKFYGFLHEKGLIEKDDLDELKEVIKEGMPEWLSALDRYDDLSVDDIW